MSVSVVSKKVEQYHMGYIKSKMLPLFCSHSNTYEKILLL